ncbi:MAG: 30S ribosomal protein S12 methylthiotransferase RimO [Solirubrobacterales bacterium]
MTKKRQKQTTVGFVALGCPKNMVDSERMLAEIVQAGFLLAAEPERADVVVVNTCGFIEPAKLESLDAIDQAIENKKRGNVQKVIVTGCLSQRLGAPLLDEADGIDAVVGLEHRDSIVRVIQDVLAADEPLVLHGPTPDGVADDRVRLRIGPAHSAYLRISEGCSHRCSFCTIPAIRGPFRSKPAEMVLEEARELASSGVVELNLIGQDTTMYGRDLKVKGALASLLRQIELIDGLSWIRLLYAYPTGIDDDLIRTLAGSRKIVHYLDIPIQHASDRVLKAMRRPDTSAALRELVEKLRAAMSDIVLRTTVIVGFPGETQADFDELLQFIRWARFDALGAFTYFPEAGTPAAEMPDQIPDEVKQARFDQLMLAQQEIAFARNKDRIGSTLTCLVDSCDPPSGRGAKKRSRPAGRGRFYGQAPDIDSACLIQGCSAQPGQLIDVRVVGTQDYDLLVEQL